jgi:hypothetical protein
VVGGVIRAIQLNSSAQKVIKCCVSAACRPGSCCYTFMLCFWNPVSKMIGSQLMFERVPPEGFTSLIVVDLGFECQKNESDMYK